MSSEGNSPVDHEEAAREIVLRQLAMQARTRAELARKLADRKVPTDVADRVLNRMTEVGLIDDATFAAAWVTSRQQRRHLSRRGLRAELSRKGVEPELITEAIADVDEHDEYTAAASLVERKRASYARLEPMVRQRRIAGLLARRGFSAAIAARVLAEVTFDENA